MPSMALLILLATFYSTYLHFCDGRITTFVPKTPCASGVIAIENYEYQPQPVPSPGFAYYTLTATIVNSSMAKKLAECDLQLEIDLLSPVYGLVPMPCSRGVGSCSKPLKEYAPYLAEVLANGETSIVIENKELCLADASIMGDIYASGQYRITMKFLEAGTHKSLACHRFETTVTHGAHPCS